MMNVHITFSDEETEFGNDGGLVSVMDLLAYLEEKPEEVAEDVFRRLEELSMILDISELTDVCVSPETAEQLRREEELAKSGDPMAAMDPESSLYLWLQDLAAIPAAGDPDVLALELLEGKDVAERLSVLMLSRVVETAWEFTGHGVLVADLIQEGSLGMWNSLSRYEGGDITEHCDRWIRQYMSKAIAAQARASGLGQKLRQRLADYVDVDQRLLTELGRNPTLEEIAEQMHVTAREAEMYASMLENARKRQAVDAARAPREETPEDEQAVEDTAYFQMRQRIGELLSGLTEQERQLLTLRYGLEGGKPLDPAETGRQLGIPSEKVIQLEAAILAKLRT